MLQELETGVPSSPGVGKPASGVQFCRSLTNFRERSSVSSAKTSSDSGRKTRESRPGFCSSTRFISRERRQSSSLGTKHPGRWPATKSPARANSHAMRRSAKSGTASPAGPRSRSRMLASTAAWSRNRCSVEIGSRTSRRTTGTSRRRSIGIVASSTTSESCGPGASPSISEIVGWGDSVFIVCSRGGGPDGTRGSARIPRRRGRRG